MSKAIIVIDEPNKCYECPLMSEDMYCKGFTPYYAKDGTHITKMCVEDDVMYGTKHSSCPLRPMGLKTKTDSYVLYSAEYLKKHFETEYMLWKELGEEE